MFFLAARTLASLVTDADLQLGRVFPDLKRIREVSATIATAVADNVFQRGLTRLRRPADLAAHIKSTMYDPQYSVYI